jgi:mannitol/fructose-specific phosphotransferase system IIA component (Ntr-type)
MSTECTWHRDPALQDRRDKRDENRYRIQRNGVNFESIDGKPCKIFVLHRPRRRKVSPHLRTPGELSRLLKDEATTEKILKAKSAIDIEKILLNVIGD